MSNLVTLFKALGDESRLSILRSLTERDFYVEVLAERLSLSPATITHHLKKLERAGLVVSRKEQYYKVFSLRKKALESSLLEYILQRNLNQEDNLEEKYNQKVIKTFIQNGSLREIPVQRKKRNIILRHLLQEFDEETSYSEAEVNEIIERYHPDFCTIRREFIAERMMVRDKGIYRRTEDGRAD